MHRPQFSIRTLLWLSQVVAAFLTWVGLEKGGGDAKAMGVERASQ